MTARILPFPRVRHRAFVLRHTGIVAAMAPAAGDKYLRQQLQVQRTTMLNRGIAPELVEPQIAALECAIRAELWRLVLTPGGAA